MTIRDLSGIRFGKLVARTRLPSLKPGDGFRWECDCDCGKQAVVKARLLTYKKGTRSCGCLIAEKNRLRPVRHPMNVKHGHHPLTGPSPEYICWSSMIQRCTNPRNESFKHYGGRGITVCAEWRSSFEQFLSDMGPRLDKDSIERKDVEGHYTRANCHWATDAEQAANRRNKRRVVVFGEVCTCAEAASRHGIPERTIYRWAKDTSGDVTAKVSAHGLKAKRRASI
ncbi:hypothetical protein LJR066_002869 [Acidovorax sp. LjRoot66]|uniref:hypothetical protein n=1 Tax=Acidovorax sp. LjRoot66 TaxID=3342334 RepID=UPI003ECF47FF